MWGRARGAASTSASQLLPRTAPKLRFQRRQHAAYTGMLIGLATLGPLRRSTSGAALSSVAECLASVQCRIKAAASERGKALNAPPRPVRLVAVSKTKPVEMLREAYDAGHRHFGENYVQELVDKVAQMPDDVIWHFIGHLQSNKVKQLVKSCPSLACIETVESEKLARAINKAWVEEHPQQKLRVMIQINSSGEESKHGCEPADCIGLCRTIVSDCKGLEIAGLMTIGAPDYSGCRTEDFEVLRKCQREVAAEIGVSIDDLELSMGMSNDFETAVREGSTSVRVGSTVFGARQYPPQT